MVECSPTEITLVDTHQTETHLEKDSSWPECSTFHKDDVLDFHLSRGEKTRFLSDEEDGMVAEDDVSRGQGQGTEARSRVGVSRAATRK